MSLRDIFLSALVALMFVAPLHGQSQAANGAIEGTIKDATGAVLPGVTVTVSNTETGDQRVVVTSEKGIYRAPLLPLGSYRVAAELTGFKQFEQTGIRLLAGQTAVVDITLEVGGIQETISVTIDSPVTEPAKIDLGRVIGEVEVKNLPLVSRNPYNFAFLQANVTGYENEEFGVPRINANGSQMHTNYQIDGNTNTEKDRAGLRLIPASEVMVREIKVITSGFAPEFGQTTGMVYNIVTPSGTNDVHGSASYRFQREGFASRPFFLSPTAVKPEPDLDNFTATLGGPLQKDRWHYYIGYEKVDRDLSSDRVITVNPAQASQLGLSSRVVPAVMPASQDVNFLLIKSDFQVNPKHRLTGRYYFFNNTSPFNIAGGLNTLERATDFNDRMDSGAAQLISTFGSNRLNELRVQYSRRHQFRTASEGSGSGPAITVSRVADFGGPVAGVSDAGFDFNQRIFQVVDNYTWISGSHNLKFGADLQFIDDDRTNNLFQLYTFPSIDTYLAAQSGANPFSYSNFTQLIGDPFVAYRSAFYGFFLQDDWRVSSSLKLLFGLRYDLFDVPQSRPFAANPLSRDFRVDKNNFGPRAGVSWALDAEAKTVLRASTGIMYEPPLINFYEDAIQRSGDPRTFAVTVNPTSAGAPPFPQTLADLPPGFTRPTQSIIAVAEDFATMYTVQTNVQIERAINRDLTLAVGYVNTVGRNLPVLVDTNLINPVGELGDGRPIFSTAVNASTRRDPTFNHIDVFQSSGELSYNALTLQVNKRMGRGLQFQASYTLAKGEDDAPLTGTYVVASGDDRLSDPTNQERDRGPTPFDQRHTFVFSAVLNPKVEEAQGALGAILNDNQIGLVFQANSGLPFNIRGNRDLNLDGVPNDRPLFVSRNLGNLPDVYNLDLRYSRFVPISGEFRLEILAEFKNLLNTELTRSVNRIVTVDAAGDPVSPLPDAEEFPPTGGYQQRQFQLGFKLHF